MDLDYLALMRGLQASSAPTEGEFLLFIDRSNFFFLFPSFLHKYTLPLKVSRRFFVSTFGGYLNCSFLESIKRKVEEKIARKKKG